jgi:hypothetical protein
MSAKSNRVPTTPVGETSVFMKNENKTKFTVFDNINVNNLGNFYNKDESNFKKKVDKLNLRFYMETDKYLNFKNEMEKSQDHLFLLLFKQISVYVEEIERLNLKVKDKEESDKFNKFKLDEISKRENLEKEISYYKNTVRNLEKKVFEGNQIEERLKKENESYRRQIIFYKDKLKLELSGKKDNCSNFNNNILNFNLITTPNETTRKIINSNFKGKFNNEETVDQNNTYNNYFSIEKVDKMKDTKVSEKETEIPDRIITETFKKKRNISAFDKNKFLNDEKKKLANIKGNTSVPPKNKFASPVKKVPSKSPMKTYQNLTTLNTMSTNKIKAKTEEDDFNDRTFYNDQAREIGDFADIFNENANEELDLLNVEEELLMNMKNEILKGSQNSSIIESSKCFTPETEKRTSSQIKESKTERPQQSIGNKSKGKVTVKTNKIKK